MYLGVPADFTKPRPRVPETDILNLNLQKVGSGLYVLIKLTSGSDGQIKLRITTLGSIVWM